MEHGPARTTGNRATRRISRNRRRNAVLGWSPMDNRRGKIVSTDVLVKRSQYICVLRHRRIGRRSQNRITKPIFGRHNRTHGAKIFWIYRSTRQNNHRRSQPIWRHISNHGRHSTSTTQLSVSIRLHHSHHATGRAPAQVVGSLVAAIVFAPGKYISAPETRNQPRRHRPEIAGIGRTVRGNRRRRKRNRALLSPSRAAHAPVFQNRYARIYGRCGKTLQRHTANLSAGTRGIFYTHNSLHQLYEPIHSPIRQPRERNRAAKSRRRVSLTSNKAIPGRSPPIIRPIRMCGTRIGISRITPIQRICAGKPDSKQWIDPLDPRITLFVGLLSGSYPALYLSAFEPAAILKGGSIKAGSAQACVRKALVVLQFAISIVLVIGTIIVADQMRLIREKDLGFNKDEVVVASIFRQDRYLSDGGQLQKRYLQVKDAFSQHPNITTASATSHLPGHSWPNREWFFPEGDPNRGVEVRVFGADEAFLNCYDIPLLSGRNYDRSYAERAWERRGKPGELFVINETAAKVFGWTDPIGKVLNSHVRKGHVIGVVKDFHYRPLYETIEPLVITAAWYRLSHLSMRIRPAPETMAFLQRTWSQCLPTRSPTIAFAADELERWYRDDQRTGQIFSAAFVIAIFVACLGLIGTGGLHRRTAHKRNWHTQSDGRIRLEPRDTAVQRICHTRRNSKSDRLSDYLSGHGSMVAAFCLSD